VEGEGDRAPPSGYAEGVSGAPATAAAFGERVRAELETAARNAEAQLGRPAPRGFVVLLHGAGHPGDRVDVDAAVAALWLGPERFYRVIDVAVVEVGPATTTVFVRASGHRPGRWEESWGMGSEAGPFKQLLAARITAPADGGGH
jgi:hypothetical protein